MTVDIINYNKSTCDGLLFINVPDNNYYSFNNISINNNNDNPVSIYDFLDIDRIYVITENKMTFNKCDTSGLYLIEKIKYYIKHRIIMLRKINNDESELVSNIDSDSNYITNNNCKLYKAGKFNNRNLYYCYECGKYIWK